jgi:hypothetical protein
MPMEQVDTNNARALRKDVEGYLGATWLHAFQGGTANHGNGTGSLPDSCPAGSCKWWRRLKQWCNREEVIDERFIKIYSRPLGP